MNPQGISHGLECGHPDTCSVCQYAQNCATDFRNYDFKIFGEFFKFCFWTQSLAEQHQSCRSTGLSGYALFYGSVWSAFALCCSCMVIMYARCHICDCQGSNSQVRVVNSLTNAVVIPGQSASSASHQKPHAILQPLQSAYPGQSLIVTSMYDVAVYIGAVCEVTKCGILVMAVFMQSGFTLF